MFNDGLEQVKLPPVAPAFGSAVFCTTFKFMLEVQPFGAVTVRV